MSRVSKKKKSHKFLNPATYVQGKSITSFFLRGCNGLCWWYVLLGVFCFYWVLEPLVPHVVLTLVVERRVFKYYSFVWCARATYLSPLSNTHPTLQPNWPSTNTSNSNYCNPSTSSTVHIQLRPTRRRVRLMGELPNCGTSLRHRLIHSLSLFL